ncbi:uncharacterized protein LOC135924668 [Gordionus sp. m RMFG-2023]|uniref:uncharacterized protein LOC135924668 n=1 Tax=Gordionus sp. m RMFG-2023 TaxID=3053472 RepID=UPI0031FDF3B4
MKEKNKNRNMKARAFPPSEAQGVDLHLVKIYAPQTGCKEEEKDDFRAILYETVMEYPKDDLWYKENTDRLHANHSQKIKRCKRLQSHPRRRYCRATQELLNFNLHILHLDEHSPCQNLIPPITEQELIIRLKHMENNKARGPDDIPIESLKALGDDGIHFLTNLYNKIPPQKWRKIYLVPIFKNKGAHTIVKITGA